MKINQKFHVWFWLNHRRQKENSSTLYMRIVVDGVRAEIATTHYIKKEHWNEKKGRMKITAPGNIQINSFIDFSRNEVKKHFLKMTEEGKFVKADQLKKRYLSVDDSPKQKTICEAFDLHNLKMGELAKIGKYSLETLGHYELTQRKVVEFLQATYKVSDLPLIEMRLRFATEFEYFLLTAYKMSVNTAHKYIKNVKKIMNMAVGLDWIPSNTLKQFKCTYANPEREILTQEELDLIINKKFNIKRLEEARDIFVFCCYTGFAFCEISKFCQTDVYIGIDGELWLSTIRQKSKTREGVPLLPIACEIYKKYLDYPHCKENNKLLPIKAYGKYNAYLDEVGTISGVTKHLTSHIARHTFATTITMANGVPIESVSSMLGHKSIATTQIYAKVIQKKVSEDMQLLKEKLFSSTPVTLKKIS